MTLLVWLLLLLFLLFHQNKSRFFFSNIRNVLKSVEVFDTNLHNMAIFTRMCNT